MADYPRAISDARRLDDLIARGIVDDLAVVLVLGAWYDVEVPRELAYLGRVDPWLERRDCAGPDAPPDVVAALGGAAPCERSMSGRLCRTHSSAWEDGATVCVGAFE
jgi:hypothetical protein